MYGKFRPAKRGHRKYKHDTIRPTMIKEIDLDTGFRVRIPWEGAHRHAFMWKDVPDIWLD
jgi:hypothetical protein